MSWGLPGQVYFDRNFNFDDGTTGEKLFVVLCDSPKNKDNSIVVKTTSKQKDPWIIGCYPNVRTPNFFIPNSSGEFDIPTWIILDEVYVYEQDTLKRWNEIFTLDMNTTISIIRCAQQSPFVELDIASKLKQTEGYLK